MNPDEIGPMLRINSRFNAMRPDGCTGCTSAELCATCFYSVCSWQILTRITISVDISYGYINSWFSHAICTGIYQKGSQR